METVGTVKRLTETVAIDLTIPIEDLSLAKKLLTHYGYDFFVKTPLQKLNNVEVMADDWAEENVIMRRLLNRGVKATKKAREDAEAKKLAMEFQYIHFAPIEVAEFRKTKVFGCYSNSSQANLGLVKWYGGWRQYCFFPAVGTLFNKGCLNDISTFLESLR